MSYTKGPWRWTDEYQARDLSDTWSLIGADGYGVLSCDGKANSPSEFHPDNARLIAAAPCLLEMLEYCEDLLMRYEINRIDGEEISDSALIKIRAAIAKAKGEVK